MRDIKDIEESILLYGIHSTYVKQILNSWLTIYRMMSNDWLQSTTTIFNYSQHLQWEEARAIKQENKLDILTSFKAKSLVNAHLQM